MDQRIPSVVRRLKRSRKQSPRRVLRSSSAALSTDIPKKRRSLEPEAHKKRTKKPSLIGDAVHRLPQEEFDAEFQGFSDWDDQGLESRNDSKGEGAAAAQQGDHDQSEATKPNDSKEPMVQRHGASAKIGKVSTGQSKLDAIYALIGFIQKRKKSRSGNSIPAAARKFFDIEAVGDGSSSDPQEVVSREMHEEEVKGFIDDEGAAGVWDLYNED